jgi:NAD-dependent dihydropyrimidine dehydrogenase PreA subunit
MKLEMKVDYYPGDTGEFIKVDPSRCTGCGECARFCVRGVWEADGFIFRPSKLKLCVECGACWNVCRFDAIIMSEPAGGTGVRFTYG